ncbi:molecular chaperone HtpG [Helicobacter monodelphidis]|uniref:molecular chaperone HtpG n=1 Tax=Helicobacter sp. 15-1451 TaxID=2004995 RepID=UPI000DCAEA32|nr:molecular chaperone HtpG [Helicobacter sp. 15-1451]RAX57808.1 molecular chaperone HtpG [Helicobacter sp. 15-1451]
MSKHSFQTEVNQLLDLMIHSLYSNKEIFLRELISNASDALEKLQYLTHTDDAYKNLEFTPKIEICINENAKTISVIDNGIGMNEAELVENLGTIARSGTKGFLNNMVGDKKKDSALIGQFGVGFYSAFMVAKEVHVVSRKPLVEESHLWKSIGKGEYEIALADRKEFGSHITLFLNDDEEEFLSHYRLSEIIRRYSDHIPFPIFLRYQKKEYDKEGKETGEKEQYEQVNKASALWRLAKSEISEEEYKEFYKSLSHDSSDPLCWVHTKVEGGLEYTTLFYIPQKAPFDLYRPDYRSGVKLYVKRVFITDDDKELLPTYLRFVRGVIDSEDLPLNVSREILQQNRILANIKSASVKKILGEIEEIAKDKERYKPFYDEFGRVLKEGLYGDFENRDRLLNLVRFSSSVNGEQVSFKEYKERMQENQKAIYYLLAQNNQSIGDSPMLERFRKKGIEVLLFDEEIDAIVMPNIQEYEHTKLVSINSKEADEEFILESVSAEEQEKFKDLIATFREELGEKVEDVVLSKKLVSSPACIVYKDESSIAIKNLMRQMGQFGDIPEGKPILEINPEHPILIRLLLCNDNHKNAEYAHLLLEQALLLENGTLKEPTSFIQRMNRILEKSI